MMTNNFANAIHFNHKNRTIEITKKFDKASSRFGTDEFKALQEAVASAPQYRVVVKETKTRDAYKGLTFEFMEKYIKRHDEDGTKWAEYRENRGYVLIDGEELEMNESLTYGEIRTWFLAVYPEFEAFSNSRKNRIETAKKARLARKQVA